MLLHSCSNERRPEPAPTFINDVMLPITPVREQGASSVCWMYAMIATIETDRIAAGDSVCLSVAYPLRRHLEEMAVEAMLEGHAYKPSMRSTAARAMALLNEYGAAPYDAYSAPSTVSYDALCRGVCHMARYAHSTEVLRQRVSDRLDARLGVLPRAVYMLHAQYTFGEFARSVYAQNYQALTSFTHHPFGHQVALELPDNTHRDTFLNIPLDTMMCAIDSALSSGYAVCWEGDITEPGFSFARGQATLPNGARCDQQHRQSQFERHLTTDDHCMALVGMAHDKAGHRFYIAKNSWGTQNPFGGLMYLSEDYVRMKTIAIIINHETYHI